VQGERGARAAGWRTGRWRVRARARACARDVAAALERLGRGGSGTRGCVSRRPGRGAWAGQAGWRRVACTGARQAAGVRGCSAAQGKRRGGPGRRARQGRREGRERKKGKENGKEKWREKKRGRERDPRRDHGADRGAGRPRLASGRARARCACRGGKTGMGPREIWMSARFLGVTGNQAGDDSRRGSSSTTKQNF